MYLTSVSLCDHVNGVWRFLDSLCLYWFLVFVFLHVLLGIINHQVRQEMAPPENKKKQTNKQKDTLPAAATQVGGTEIEFLHVAQCA